MAFSDREQALLKLIGDKEISVADIAKSLYISQPTVRRDLASLERQGLIIRTHGGAVANHQNTSFNIVSQNYRQTSFITQKKQIAIKASQLLHNDMIIMLDASTTAYYLCEHIKKFRNMTVITNGLQSATFLCESDVNVIFAGGNLTNRLYSSFGDSALCLIRSYNADICFISCHGIDNLGMVTETHPPENDIRKAMMACSKQKVLLVDSSKLGQQYWNNLCHKTQFDKIFCDIDF